jgi:hypothetical protein
MARPAPIFDTIYRDYLRQVARLDFSEIAPRLGLRYDTGRLLVPLFGRPFYVTKDAIADAAGMRPDNAVVVPICKYLLMCPGRPPEDAAWVAFRDFRDAAPFVGAFADTVEGAVSRHFSGRIEDLRVAAFRLGGRPPELDLAYDLTTTFEGLPRVPLLLLYNDADTQFPAECKVLFERRASTYLDMECLAILGMRLSGLLKSDASEDNDQQRKEKIHE